MFVQEKRNIDFDRLLWLAMEESDNYQEYSVECAKYRAQHGCMAYIDIRNGLTEETARIHYAYERYSKSRDVISACCDVIGFDRGCYDRFPGVVRAVRRWFVRNNWENVSHGIWCRDWSSMYIQIDNLRNLCYYSTVKPWW